MATYVRYAGEHVAERIRPARGSDEEAHLERLVADGAGWSVEGDTSAPTPRSRAAKKRTTAEE